MATMHGKVAIEQEAPARKVQDAQPLFADPPEQPTIDIIAIS